MSKRTTWIFFIFLSYIVLQFLWWEILLVRHSNEIIHLKQNIAAISSSDEKIILRDIAELQNRKTLQVYMIAGEGTVFLLILLYGAYLVRKAIKQENELLSQKNNFILSVSHELKTPIAATKLQLQTLLKHELDREKQKELLNNALTENNRLHKLVDNVLIVNQIENNNLGTQKQLLNLSDLVKETLTRYFNALIESKHISLNIDDAITYTGDKELLSSVIINLIENSIKYSFNDVAITVSLKKEDVAVLKIADNGCGIDDKDKRLLFNKFYRSGNENTRKTKGTGLGLYIVKNICNLHKISISVKDNTPKGTIFELRFNA